MNTNETKPAQGLDAAAKHLAAEINETFGVGCAAVGHDGENLRVYWHVDGAPMFDRFMGYHVVVEYIGKVGPAGGTGAGHN